MDCINCSSYNTHRIGLHPDSDPYERCHDCGTIFLTHLQRLDPTIYSPSYVANLDTNRDKYGNLFLHYKEALYHLIKKSTGTFLEVGFSNPGILYGLRGAGWETVGMDISPYSPQA